MKKFLIAVWGCLAVSLLDAKVRVPRFFSDGMVLQRERPVPVWGWAESGEHVIVTLYEGQTPLNIKSVTASADGQWRVELPAMKAGGPYVLKIESQDDDGQSDERTAGVVLSDVLVGDVFLCSGQSNMELQISRCMDLYRDEVSAYSNNRIRYLKLPHQYNYVRPQEDVAVKPWTAITPETAPQIGALCYFFAKYMQENAGVPVGIVNSSVGGTKVEAWMSQGNLKHFDDYKDEFNALKYHQENWPDSVNKAELAAGMAWERNMIRLDTIVGKWGQNGYDFSSWPLVDVFKPHEWNGGGQRPGPGSYWFRQVVTLPSSVSGQVGLIRVGAMVDADSVFVNGHFVGYTSYQYPPRIYKIPKGILREGQNEVMVHLMAQNGGPSFVSGKLYQIEVGEEVFPLASQWAYAKGSSMSRKPGSTYFVDTPSALYNAMIAPFKDFAFRGIVWYQGESNVGRPDTYQAYLEAMIKEWREQFDRNLPLVVVQLAGFQQRHKQPVESNQARLREAQRLAALSIPDAGLATAVDIGEWNDIHPQNKKELGRRVALQMQGLCFGAKRQVVSGPQVKTVRRKNDYIKISFDRKTGKLSPSSSLKSIALAGTDGKYVWADARTDGDYTVVVDIPDGMQPVSVRYAWDDFPECSIYNVEGLPASPFMMSVN